jgi:hypothetical protein
MLRRTFALSADQISTAVAHYAIGLVTVRVQNDIEEAVCAGSGSLVTIGSLHGMLTAAHVLDALPKQGAVGVVLRVKSNEEFHKHVITMEHTDSVTIRGREFRHLRPDVGFLRLPNETIGWLKAKSSFYNLLKRRDVVMANVEPSKSYVDCLMGLIHEETKDVQSESH